MNNSMLFCHCNILKMLGSSGSKADQIVHWYIWESKIVPTDWKNGFIVPKEGWPHQLANGHITRSTRKSFSSILHGRTMMQLTANYDKNQLALDVEDRATTKCLFHKKW